MSPLVMPSPKRLRNAAPRYMATTSASGFSSDEDEDAITPCSSPPPPEPLEPEEYQPAREARPQRPHADAAQPGQQRQRAAALSAQSSRRGSRDDGRMAWHFDPTDGEDMDDEHLWRRMLAIQQALHCYNSARMGAALLKMDKGEDLCSFVPSRSCLDLLNDSISKLSEEDRKRLAEWLQLNCFKGERRSVSTECAPVTAL